MNLPLTIKWINDGIIDFSQLILQNYNNIGLNETDAFVIIELHKQFKSGITSIDPKKIVNKVSVSLDELLVILNRLMQDNFLSMEIVMTESGKEAEIFNLNNAVEKILKYNHQIMDGLVINQAKTFATSEEELVDMIENQLQKQLTPLEIEIIRKWIAEDRYPIFDIKKALLDAVKANKASLSYVDGILLKRHNIDKKNKAEQSLAEEPEALKTFFESWPKK